MYTDTTNGLPSRTKGREATLGVIPGRFALSVGKPDLPSPPDWEWTALSSVAQMESGHTPSRRHSDYWDGGIPWVGIKDAVDRHGRTIDDTYQHVSSIGLANSSARLLPAHTVCLSRTASIGYVVVMGRSMATSQDFINWVCGPVLEPNYLKYILVAERDSLFRFASGTTHQTIYYPEAKAFYTLLPPIGEQRRILDILCALDDKIEINQEVNKTLESIARALFKSWFVDFDPVRAKSQGRVPAGMDAETAKLFPNAFCASESGQIPDGWSLGVLRDIVQTFNSKRIPLSARERAQRSGIYPYYGAASVVGHVDAYLFDGPHVLMGEDGSVVNPDGSPVLQYVWRKFWVNNHAHVLKGAHGVSDEHLLHLLRNVDVRPYVTGAAQPKLNQGNLFQIPICRAPESICLAFGATLAPLYARLRAAADENATLAELRDTLLPKLISGEIRIKDAEKLASAAL